MSPEVLDDTVLSRIAIANGMAREDINLGINGAVFYRRGGELLCLCQKGSPYWNEIEAGILAEAIIKRARR